MRPFAFMARCQRENWKKQWDEYDVDLFDLRVRFEKRNDLPYLCHGLMEYDADVFELIREMAKAAKSAGTDTYIRVVLEMKRPSERDILLFRGFCALLQNVYGDNLHFWGGNDRSDWSYPHFAFRTPMQDVDDKYSSTTTLFPRGFKWLRYLDDLCPILYARLHNRRNIERGTSHEWLFIDFVDIR